MKSDALRAASVPETVHVRDIHSLTGHGPEILTLITGPAELLDFHLDPTANLAQALGIRQMT